MAACSEQEGDGNPSEATLHRTSLLNTKNDDREQYNIEKQNKPQDLKNLSDDEFLNLLEEASTFNKPSNQASDLLQQLRNEIAEKDSCGNVDKTESAHSADHGTLVYGRSRKSRNAFTKGRGSHGMDILLADALSVGTHGCSNLQKPVENHINKKRSGTVYKSKEDPSGRSVIDSNRLDRSGLQSQSLQDLATTKLDSLESTRNIGIGRGMRKLQKSQRASSFSSSEVSEHAAQLHLSALEPIRNSLKDAKSTFSKLRQNSLPPDGASSERNVLTVNNNGKATESSLVKSNYAALEDSDVLNSSPERTCSNNVGCVGINKGSSCDNVCNRFKYEASLSSKTTDTKEYKNSSAISIVSPVELELKEIKVNKNKNETDNIAENMIEHIYHQRCDNKTYKDNTDVDVSVGFPLNCGHLRSQCNNLVQSSMESISTDQTLPNVLKGIHCESKANGDDKAQKKKKKNLRQESTDGNVFQEILPSSSFIRSFDDSRQFCAVDINGNPKPYHSNSKVPYGITAVLPPSTFDCYPSGVSFHSENQSKSDLTLRKGKRNRNNVDNQKYIVAEQIPGHRGQDDIEDLLHFINSSDSKVKAAKTNGNSNGSNQTCTSSGKHIVTLENDKKKDRIAMKPKNQANLHKKKTNHLSSEEDESQEKLGLQERELDNKHIPAVENFVAKDESTVISKWSDDKVHIDVEEKSSCASQPIDKNPNLHLATSANFFPTDSSMKNFTASGKCTGVTNDIYDTVGQQKFEESEFRVVLKKQRKRYPLRKSDSGRRYYTNSSNSSYNDGRQYFDQASHKDDIMLLRGLPLSHRSQRNKQDCTRRKSTSSVPPSEHSSADNSDLDSVHSLPVSGSVPAPTRTHPHTTPPSTSSTPQASYADIARMSIAPTPKSYCNSLYGTFACNVEQSTLRPDSTSVLADLLSSSIDCQGNTSEKDRNNNNNQLSLVGCAQINKLESPDKNEGCLANNSSKTVREESPQLVENLLSSPVVKTCCENTLQETSMTNCTKNNTDNSAASHTNCSSDVGDSKATNNNLVCQNSHYNSVLNNPKYCENNVNIVGKTNSPLLDVQGEGSVRTEVQGADISQPMSENAPSARSALPEDMSDQVLQQPNTVSDIIQCPNTVVVTNSNNPKQINNKVNPNSEFESLTEQLCYSGRQDRPPVIILDNYLPTESACGVSFGIDPDELLQLSAGGNIVTNTNHSNSSVTSLSTVTERSQDSEGSVSYSCSSVVNAMHETEGQKHQPHDSSSSPSPVVFLSNEDSLVQGQNITSSPSSKVLLLKSGQPLHWREMDADKGSFNFYQIVGFLGNAWEILQDCDPGGGSSQGKEAGRVCYYSDQ